MDESKLLELIESHYEGNLESTIQECNKVMNLAIDDRSECVQYIFDNFESEIIEYCGKNELEEVMQEIEDMIMSTYKPERFIQNFGDSISTLADSNDLCDICGSELEEVHSDEMSDAYGSYCSEDFITHKCTNMDCGNYEE